MEERLQKVLAAAGLASRREAEKIILAGRVKVNNKVVTELGTKVGPTALILVDGKGIHREQKVYRLFNKPRGVVTTMKDPQGRRCIADYVEDLDEKVFPVGRLDYNTEGLLLLTNDGELAQGLMHPKNEINKTYLATVLGTVPDEKLDQLRMGVKLEDGLTAPAIVNLIEYDHERLLTTFDITIHEGRNRQIRRMCDFVGFPVRSLKRTKLATLTLTGLKRGGSRDLDEQELVKLFKAAGMDPEKAVAGVSVRKTAKRAVRTDGETERPAGKRWARTDGETERSAGKRSVHRAVRGAVKLKGRSDQGGKKLRRSY